jgi:hypothetical protein
MTNPQRSFREASVAGYDGFFADAVARLHVERRYRIYQRMIGAGDVARAARPGAKPGGGFNTSGYISNQASISDKGTERSRITPTPCHDDAELAAALVEVWNELDLPRGNLPYAAE